MSNRIVSFGLVLLFALAASPLSGCFGKFALTQKVYKWNNSLGNKFVKTLVFWAFCIIPVYEVVVGFLDPVIFNLIEFWSGSNPLAMGPNTQPRVLADGSIEVQHSGVTYRIVPMSETRFQLFVNGALAGEGGRTDDGGMHFTTRDGKTVRLSKEQVQTAQARFERVSELTRVAGR